jgi:hypothetical protein
VLAELSASMPGDPVVAVLLPSADARLEVVADLAALDEPLALEAAAHRSGFGCHPRSQWRRSRS